VLCAYLVIYVLGALGIAFAQAGADHLDHRYAHRRADDRAHALAGRWHYATPQRYR
jgi:hypothetical protein